MAHFDFNKVILAGRLTADVELKQTPSGVSVCTFRIAVKRKGKDAKTDFHDIVAWRQTAEFISRYFKKGNSICIVGSLQNREWTDDKGIKRYATEVITEEASFVDSKSDSAEQPAFTPASPQFEEVTDDSNLPF